MASRRPQGQSYADTAAAPAETPSKSDVTPAVPVYVYPSTASSSSR